MNQFVLPAICLAGGVFGLWQVFSGWRTGRMFAFDPPGSTAFLKRSDGWLFIFGWWVTLLMSLGGLAFGIGMLFHG